MATESGVPARDEHGYLLGVMPGQLSPSGTHYRLEGDTSSSLVVLVNGIFDPPTRWDLLVPDLLAAGFQTLRYDPYGRCWSPAPPGFRYDVQAHVDQLQTLIKELDLTGAQVAIVAHSAGAITAQKYAELTPSVASLVLLAPAGAMRAPVCGFRALQAVLDACGECGVGVVQRLLSGPSPPDFVVPAAAGAERERVAELARRDAAWHAAQARANSNRALAASVLRLPLTNLQLSGELRERGVRALVLTAAADVQVRGVRARFYKRVYGDLAEVAPEAEAGGHCFFIQDAATVNPRVVDFLTLRRPLRAT